METLKNVVCPVCTCLCDDLIIARDRGELKIRNACPKSERWFQQDLPGQNDRGSGQDNDASYSRSIQTANEALARSSAPLICGLDHLVTAAQQSAWRLADRIGATLDTTLKNSGRGSMFSLQRHGKVTATLGEVASRSDLVLFWYCDPATTHPRHFERTIRPEQRPKKIVVVDQRRTATAEIADTFIQLPHESAESTLSFLRTTIAGERRGHSDTKLEIDGSDRSGGIDRADGIDEAVWEAVAAELVGSSYGAWFYGHTTHDSSFDLASDSLASLIRLLNQRTRFVALAMREDANAQSAENVLAWSSGFPFAINLCRRFPRFNGLEFSAETVLEREECDLILLASTGSLDRTLPQLSDAVRCHFERTPKIVIDEVGTAETSNTVVTFSVSQPGKNGGGEFCRQDDISLRLTNVCPSPTAPRSAESVLKTLLNQSAATR